MRPFDCDVTVKIFQSGPAKICRRAREVNKLNLIPFRVRNLISFKVSRVRNQTPMTSQC